MASAHKLFQLQVISRCKKTTTAGKTWHTFQSFLTHMTAIQIYIVSIASVDPFYHLSNPCYFHLLSNLCPVYMTILFCLPPPTLPHPNQTFPAIILFEVQWSQTERACFSLSNLLSAQSITQTERYSLLLNLPNFKKVYCLEPPKPHQSGQPLLKYK